MPAKCLTYDYLEFKLFQEKKEKIFVKCNLRQKTLDIIYIINIKYFKIIIIMNGK